MRFIVTEKGQQWRLQLKDELKLKQKREKNINIYNLDQPYCIFCLNLFA